MDNAFRIFDLPEYASLDEEMLRERYHQLSRSLHPDAAGSAEEFEKLSSAYGVLKSPAARLRHLLELRSGSRIDLRGSLPPGHMALFGRLSDCLHRCDQLHRTRASASTLGKALLEDQFLALQQELFAMQGDLHQLHTLAQARLPAADALLKSTPSGVPSETAQLCRELIYLERWSAQVDSQLHRFL